jgi:hypothetical protein
VEQETLRTLVVALSELNSTAGDATPDNRETRRQRQTERRSSVRTKSMPARDVRRIQPPPFTAHQNYVVNRGFIARGS